MELYTARDRFIRLNGSIDMQCVTDLTADSDKDRSAWAKGDYFNKSPKDYKRYYSATKLMDVCRAYTAYSEMAIKEGGVCHAIVKVFLNSAPTDLPGRQVCGVAKQERGLDIATTVGSSSSNLEFNYIGAMSWTELQKQYSVSREVFEIADIASGGDAREALRHCIDAARTNSVLGQFTFPVDSAVFAE
jgi:hypothetical protein